MKKILTVAVAIFLQLTNIAVSGPFGIEMGDSQSSLNVSIKLDEGSFLLSGVKNPHPLFSDYIVHIAETTGVCSVVAGSKKYSLRTNEADLRSDFRSLEAQIRNKYNYLQSYGDMHSKFETSRPEEFENIELIELQVVEEPGTAKIVIVYNFHNIRKCSREIQTNRLRQQIEREREGSEAL